MPDAPAPGIAAPVKRLVGFALGALLALVPTRATSQSRMHRRWELPGLDFSPNGVWRKQARQVAQARAALLARGDFQRLNAPLAAAGAPAELATVVSGILKVPAVLFTFKDTPGLPLGRDTASYTTLLFGPIPPGGRPFTLRTYYEQMSNGLLSIQGNALGYVTLDSNEVTYAGPPPCVGSPFHSTYCNGLFSYSGGQPGPSPFTRMQNGLREALAKIDGAMTIDWSQYDSDGDGVVDLVAFAQPMGDGACGGANHIWGHRGVLGPPFVTTTPWAGHPGEFIRVADYTLQSGVGGAGGCNSSEIMSIGTIAHETGHGFGLPDLYDVTYSTAGVGDWSLMGGGLYTTADSPSRMDAWSLAQLGWVTLRPLTLDATYVLGPAPMSDTAFYVRVGGTNPRGEYFLLENREAVEADTALIRFVCGVSGSSIGCGGGVLIWHIDSARACPDYRMCGNGVNASVPHGVAVEEADGLNELESFGGNQRGDAGDVYPGTSRNTAFSFNTSPAALKNLDGSFVGFVVDSIRKSSVAGPVSLRVRFGGWTVVKASDTTALVQVDGQGYHRFGDLFEDVSTHTIAFADSQLSPNGRTRFIWKSWSDGGAIAHQVTGSPADATYVATVARQFKLVATANAGGAIGFDPPAASSGTFLDEGMSVTVTAKPSSGYVLEQWLGDTSTTNASVTLLMARPYTIAAVFAAPLVISSGSARPDGVMGAAYKDTLRAVGGTGTNAWTSGALPSGLALGASTGIISGFPRQSGDFSFTAEVTSGSQRQSRTFSVTVTEPDLATAAVVTQLLGPGAPLTADEVRYVDYLGNGNGVFDIGDFLAWVKSSGAPISAVVIQRLGGLPRSGSPP